ncbi:hypothetical protein BB558_004410 [Smittium angustum]|uniref:Pre-mRNA-splicing factor CEF1 n=1 Tax=Smittium angustum TaxID=133377 RepID=A0A2U1J304_SMIAN|nr:hypothetical protein BB558_004410 [Smittium angustum]
MRVIVKGGVWKNTEDEILKAAVMKYGKNQWARISSLLVRKTPKQCKARWFEWLDPSIKKTEWSKDEDEKLLHLAKLMPTQWRTIAPIVGRTPAQCLERYQKLLDDAEAHMSGTKDDLSLQGPQGGEFGDITAEDIRRLRPGEIDPDPESKPARPDPVDMDEDEKEIRELKAAGIEIKKTKKRKHMDYNTDIPFEKRPAPGFYETYDELKSKGLTQGPGSKKLQNIEPKKRWEREEDALKKQQEKKKKKDGKDGSDAIAFVRSKLDAAILEKEQLERLSSRKKLILPQPQVSDAELETIARIAQQGEQAQRFVESDNIASQILLGDYSSHGRQSITARTPQLPAQTDSVMAEAINLVGLTSQQTPLLGEENTPFHTGSGTGFEGITPASRTVQTPNPLMTPLRMNIDGSSTVGKGEYTNRVPRTPYHDELGLNTPLLGIDSVSGTPNINEINKKRLQKSLSAKLSSLPAPKNQFEIVIPDLKDIEASELSKNSRVEEEYIEDREIAEKKLAMKRAEEDKKRLERRSTPVKMDLPRPLFFDGKSLKRLNSFNKLKSSLSKSIDKDDISAALELISLEMAHLITSDGSEHPYIATKYNTSRQSITSITKLPDQDNSTIIGDQEIIDARQLIQKEYEILKEELNLDSKKTDGGNNESLTVDQISTLPINTESKHVFVPSKQSFISMSDISSEDYIESCKNTISQLHDQMVKDATKATKMEKKQNILLGGYLERSKVLSKKIMESFKELEDSKLAQNSFRFLQACEQTSIPIRIQTLQEQVGRLGIIENDLQQKYKDLFDRYNSLHVAEN